MITPMAKTKMAAVRTEHIEVGALRWVASF